MFDAGTSCSSFSMLVKYSSSCCLVIFALFHLMFVTRQCDNSHRPMKFRAQSSPGILFLNFLMTRLCLVRYPATIIRRLRRLTGNPQLHNMIQRVAKISSSWWVKTVGVPMFFVCFAPSLFCSVDRGILYLSWALRWLKDPFVTAATASARDSSV